MAKPETDINLLKESDRGCILVAAAMLDTRLSTIFEERFTQNKISKKLLKSIFSVLGPLGTFSSKIQLAYALNYISRKSHDDLELIRKLRNKAAHTTSDMDFLNKEDSEMIEKLNCVEPFKDKMKLNHAGSDLSVACGRIKNSLYFENRTDH